jgi:hypothetical protein
MKIQLYLASEQIDLLEILKKKLGLKKLNKLLYHIINEYIKNNS